MILGRKSSEVALSRGGAAFVFGALLDEIEGSGIESVCMRPETIMAETDLLKGEE